MAIVNSIPQVWAAHILRAYDTRLVYAGPGVANRSYQGSITSGGDTVRITTLTDPIISTYERNKNIAEPEALSDAQLQLVIDQEKTFNYAIDDVDLRQTAVTDIEEVAAHRAGYQLAKTVDTFMAEKAFKEADAANEVGSTGSPKHALKTEEMYKVLVELFVKLNEADVPEDNRFAVVPPFAVGALLQDPRFVSFGTAANRANLEKGMMTAPNGLVGSVAGFNIYSSNSVPNTSGAKYKIVAGIPDALAAAEQLAESVNFRPERRFANGYKGLLVYGGKVVRSSALAVATVNNEA